MAYIAIFTCCIHLIVVCTLWSNSIQCVCCCVCIGLLGGISSPLPAYVLSYLFVRSLAVCMNNVRSLRYPRVSYPCMFYVCVCVWLYMQACMYLLLAQLSWKVMVRYWTITTGSFNKTTERLGHLFQNSGLHAIKTVLNTSVGVFVFFSSLSWAKQKVTHRKITIFSCRFGISFFLYFYCCCCCYTRVAIYSCNSALYFTFGCIVRIHCTNIRKVRDRFRRRTIQFIIEWAS